MTVVSSRFRRGMDTSVELVLKPQLEAYLFRAKFPDHFTVPFRKAGVARKPDGWFHPSTHPGWTERQLYFYFTAPDDLEPEQLDYSSRMAVTMGTAVHGFIEMCVRKMGASIPLKGTCPACGREHGTKKGQCDEYGAADVKLRSRGHMDSVIKIERDGKYWRSGIGGFELKSSNERKVSNVKDNDIEAFRAKWPEYYDQIQNYMEITGLPQFLVLFVVLGYPWRMVEFQVPYDPERAMQIKRKYESVLDHVERGEMPEPCCGPGSVQAKSCIARSACPIGRMSQ